MTWMNEFDIEEAQRMLEKYAKGSGWDEAALALYSLMTWVNSNSDGWSYWRKPSQASQKLQDALTIEVDAIRRGFAYSADLDPETARPLFRPIKAFLTRQGADWRTVLFNDNLPIWDR